MAYLYLFSSMYNLNNKRWSQGIIDMKLTVQFKNYKALNMVFKFEE